MRKTQMVTAVSFSVTPAENVRFSKETQDTVRKNLVSLLRGRPGVGQLTFDMRPERMYLATHITNSDALQFAELVRLVEEEVVVLTEHGKDADLLLTLFERHPELRNHPKIDRVIGAYENLRNVIASVEGDRNEVIAHAMEEQSVPIDAFLAKKLKGASAVDRAAHRTKALLGQNEDQTQMFSKQDAYVPPQYMHRDHAAEPQGFDRGNVFGS